MRRTGVIGTPLGTAGEKWSSGTDGTFEAGSAVERVNTIVNGTEDYDIITFAYGTNTDVDGEGTVNDEPAYDGTMCAAIKWCIEQLVAWKPTISIGIILPPKRADMGTSGNTLMKTRGALIKEVASMYGVPCCDMWSESGINLMHYTNPDTGNEKYYYLSDMLHLSDNGKIQYGKRLKAFLEEITPIY
jgi:lysophospholipase L1-like esterase